MNLGLRLKNLRRDLHLSQEELGAQGFVSAPGWIKIENGQRLPSDRLIVEIVRWLAKSKHIASAESDRLREELLTLKYLSHRSEFVRELAQTHQEKLASSNSGPVGVTPVAGGGSGRARLKVQGKMKPGRTTTTTPAAAPAAKATKGGKASSSKR